MATFDATAYRNDVLKPNSRGEAFEQLREVVAEVTRDADSTAYARLDLNALYAIPSPVTAAQLVEWRTRVVPALNKAEKSLPAASLLKILFEALEKKGVNLTAPAFWGGLQAERQKVIVVKLNDDIKQLRAEYPLGVISVEELTSRLASIGITGVTEGSIRSVAAQQGFDVVADVELPGDGMPVPLRAIWKQVSAHPEFRSIIDILLMHRAGQLGPVRFIDGLEVDGGLVTGADIDGARAKSEQGQDTDALQSAQKFLGALKDNCRDDAALHQVVLASVVELAAGHLARGKPKVRVRDDLVGIGFETTDASRLVMALSAANLAPARTLGLDDVREKLAEGLLDDADRVLVAVAETDETARDHAAVTMQVTQLKAKKKSFLDAYHRAVTAREFGVAAQAIRDAIGLDRGDDSLAALAESLPPSPPRSFMARVDGAAVLLTWAHDADPTIKYTVVRRENRIPSGPGDGTVVVADVNVVSTSDAAVTAAARFGYAVFASRDGRVYSDAATTEITVLLAPSHVAATATATSVELSWVLPAGAVGTVVTQLNPDNRSVQHEVARGTSFRADGLTSGSRYQFSVQAVHFVDAGRRLSERVSTVAVPRGRASPVSDLTVTTRRDDGRDLLQARWTGIDGFEVEIWVFPRNVDLPVGSTFDAATLTQSGGARIPPRGTSRTASGHTQMTLAIPPVISRLVPLTGTDTGYLIGASVLAGSAAQATGITAEVFGTELRLSWTWPPGDALMELRWTESGRSRSTRVSRAQYRSDSGAMLDNAATVADLTIATVVQVGGDEWSSPAVPVAHRGGHPGLTLTYSLQIKRTLFGNKTSCSIEVHSDGTGTIVPVSLVLKSGSTMPFGPGDGRKIADLDLDFTNDTTVTHELTLGKQPAPIWLRLFAGDGSTELVDPPTSQLKG
jgi:hypothetical protein